MGGNKGNWGRYGLQAFVVICIGKTLAEVLLSHR